MDHAVIKYIEARCRFMKYPGKYSGQRAVLREWQKEIIRDLFTPDGQIKKSHLLLRSKRKIGKTQFFAWILCYIFLDPNKEGIEIPIIGDRHNQVKDIWRITRESIKLADDFDPKQYKALNESIEHKESGNRIYMASSAVENSYGKQPYPVIVFEEIQTYKDIIGQDLVSNWTSGMQKANTLTAFLCNPSDDLNNQFFIDLMKRFKDNKESEDYSTWIFQADPEIPFDSEKAWMQADPNLAEDPPYTEITNFENIRQKAEAAKASVQAEDAFRRSVLGQNVYKAADAFVDIRKFKIIPNPDLDLPLSIGADLSLSKARSSVCYTRKLPNNRGFLFSFKTYIPEGALDLIGKTRAEKQRRFEKQGFLTIQPGGGIDLNQIEDDMKKEIKKSKHPVSLNYDPACGANTIGQNLSAYLPVNKMLNTGRFLTPLISNFERAVEIGMAYMDQDNLLAKSDFNNTYLKSAKAKGFKLMDRINTHDFSDSSFSAVYSLYPWFIKKRHDWSKYIMRKN